jgi:hypothetical protein
MCTRIHLLKSITTGVAGPLRQCRSQRHCRGAEKIDSCLQGRAPTHHRLVIIELDKEMHNLLSLSPSLSSCTQEQQLVTKHNETCARACSRCCTSHTTHGIRQQNAPKLWRLPLRTSRLAKHTYAHAPTEHTQAAAGSASASRAKTTHLQLGHHLEIQVHCRRFHCPALPAIAWQARAAAAAPEHLCHCVKKHQAAAAITILQ